jgi:hypothetical protein
MKTSLTMCIILLYGLSAFAQAPGGVSGGLTHWFKADAFHPSTPDNTALSSWPDQSGSGNDCVQTGAVFRRPLYRRSRANGHPSIAFNGGTRFFDVNFTSTYGTSFTMIAVVRRGSSGANQFFLGSKTAAPNPALSVGYMAAPNLRFAEYGSIAQTSVPAFFSGIAPSIAIAEFSTTTGKTISDILDGVVSRGTHPSTTNFAATADGWIGRGNSGTGMVGELHEIIIYNRTLSTTELRQIQSYLSVKYGLSIAVADHLYYNDASYPNDLVAIGRDAALSGLNQETSSSENNDDMLEISGASSLDNGDYLCLGHNNGALSFSTYTGANCQITQTMTREWRAKVTNTPGTVNLRFDLASVSGYTASDLVLLVDNDGDGYDDELPITGTFSTPYITFSNIAVSNNARIRLGHYVSKWYAVLSGNSSGAIWASSPSASPRALTGFCSRTDIEVNNGVTVTNDVAMTCRHLTVPSGATFNGMSSMLVLHGDLSVDGDFSTTTASVYFNGTTAQQMTGSKYLEFHNVYCNNPAGVTVNSTSAAVKRLLQVNSGTFYTNDIFTLLSTPSGTASIGPLISGSISGQLIWQRYISPLVNGWINLCPPVQSQMVGDWFDDFIMSGFPGSHYPSYAMNNVMWYDETFPGGRNSGYIGATGLSDPIRAKQGYFVYMNAAATTVDNFGTIYSGNQALPVSYTNTGNAVADGWCLVSNPYPSTIDWDATGWTKTNMANAVYIWNAAAGQYASYVGGVSANGGSRHIASGQAFFVQATAAAPQLVAAESIKTTTAASFRSEEESIPTFTLAVSGNGRQDEVTLAWRDGATVGYDVWADAAKLYPPMPEGLFITMPIEGDEELSINSIERSLSPLQLRVSITSSFSGEYNLTPSGLETFASGACVNLRRISDNHVFRLEDGNSISIVLTANETMAFVLETGTPVLATIQDATCAGSNDGTATVTDKPDGVWNLLWKDGLGNIIHESVELSVSSTLTGLAPGSYSIEALGNGVCGSTIASFIIGAPEAPRMFTSVRKPTCQAATDGAVEITLEGGQSPHKLRWDDGFTGFFRDQLSVGHYNIMVVDEWGCEHFHTLQIEPESSFGISILTESELFTLAEQDVNVAVRAEHSGSDLSWKLNDQMIEGVGDFVQLQLHEPGLYTLEAETTSGMCRAIDKKLIRVVPAVQISWEGHISAAWISEDVLLNFDLPEETQLQISAYNTAGQLTFASERHTVHKGTLRLPALTTGPMMILVIRNVATGQTQTFRLIRL